MQCLPYATDLTSLYVFRGRWHHVTTGDLAPLVIQPTEATWELISQQLDQRNQQQVKAPIAPGAVIQPQAKAESKHDEPAATCSVGVAGADIDPYGNVQACMHLQESAGNLHQQSIEEIWNHLAIVYAGPESGQLKRLYHLRKYLSSS